MSEPIIIDLTNYKDRVGSRVPEGDYNVVVDDVELDKSKAGNPMVNVWFRINAPGSAVDGQTITDRLTLTEKAMFRVVGFMQAIGLPTPKKRLQVDLNQFRNQPLIITVGDGEPYNGRIKSEVRGYMIDPNRAQASAASASAEADFMAAAQAPAAAVPAAAPAAVFEQPEAVVPVAEPVAAAAPAAAPVEAVAAAPAADPVAEAQAALAAAQAAANLAAAQAAVAAPMAAPAPAAVPAEQVAVTAPAAVDLDSISL